MPASEGPQGGSEMLCLGVLFVLAGLFCFASSLFVFFLWFFQLFVLLFASNSCFSKGFSESEGRNPC